MSVDDFTSEHDHQAEDDEASVDSRVRRNEDKPMRVITIEPGSNEPG